MRVRIASPLLWLFLISCGGGSSESPTLSSIVVTPAHPSVPAGVTEQFTATGRYSDGSSRDLTPQVSWSSLVTSVATISSTGLATAVAPGTTTITATSGNISGSTPFTVNSSTLSSISTAPVNPRIPSEPTDQFSGSASDSAGINRDFAPSVNPANLTLPVGVTRQLGATGLFSDGTSYDITAQVSWSSSNPWVATVNSGLVTAVSPGAAIITATSGVLSSSAVFTVTAATLSSISITPADPILPVGVTEPFRAAGTYSDGTNYDISGQVSWASSDPSVATINSGGLAATTGAGTATITAVSGSSAGSTTLFVTIN